MSVGRWGNLRTVRERGRRLGKNPEPWTGARAWEMVGPLRSTVPVLLSFASTCAGCELASPPFKVRAVRRSENKWTGDVFLTKWAPGANLTISFADSSWVHHANHANVTRRFPGHVSLTLHETGPEDGAGRVMVRCHGSRAVVPTRVCANTFRAHEQVDVCTLRSRTGPLRGHQDGDSKRRVVRQAGYANARCRQRRRRIAAIVRCPRPHDVLTAFPYSIS